VLSINQKPALRFGSLAISGLSADKIGVAVAPGAMAYKDNNFDTNQFLNQDEVYFSDPDLEKPVKFKADSSLQKLITDAAQNPSYENLKQLIGSLLKQEYQNKREIGVILTELLMNLYEYRQQPTDNQIKSMKDITAWQAPVHFTIDINGQIENLAKGRS
jgi:hypothetical protein